MIFADTAKVLAGVARSHGLTAPSYRTPPRTVGIDRTVRRTAHGGAIAVRVKGRPWPAVVADMIDGVIAINKLSSAKASRVRADLWDAVLERVLGEPKPAKPTRVA